jgi:hypothetical protein
MENEAPKTISVPQAGKRYFDLGKNASYEAARRGDLPVIRIGGKLRVPVVALERMLSDAGSDRSINEDTRLRIETRGFGSERPPECTGAPPLRQTGPLVRAPQPRRRDRPPKGAAHQVRS